MKSLLGSLGLLLLSQPLHAQLPADPTTDGWKLIFVDEFEGDALDLTKWSYRQLGKRESAMISKDCISLDGKGHLLVSVMEKDGVLQNGMIGTLGKFSATYGRFEARMKFPEMQGQHGSFWMQPDKPGKEQNNAAVSGAEIDIIEWFGAGRRDGGTASNIYWPSGKGNHAGGTKDFKLLPPGEKWSDNFHIYGLEWSATEYVFRVDGKETYRIKEGVSQVPQYLILSLLTADWEVKRLDKTKLPNAMLVDWVKVWQKP